MATQTKQPRKPNATECRDYQLVARVTASTLQKIDELARTAGTSRADVVAALVANAPATLGAATPTKTP